ncbi:PAS domain S-box protein [Terrisporobacter mayombei]|uniref:histidine kinase n=1 Tax=Terrisporobacter mayombei TaxID=1541 RepID=A0ABY9PZC2_9FIRM|nr:PAS domain S-box protein [Terrisporobacter mayombei]WMT81068.1 Adaptive-response sensory-kinase SasA [Terrisporobacter mayombei]
MENYNDEKSIFIIGKEVNSKPYNIEVLEDILDNINICTYALDEDGKYIYGNKTFADILNINREDIIGVYNKDYWKHHIYKEFEKNNKYVFESKSPQKFNEKIEVDGHIHCYRSYKVPIYNENGKPKYIVASTKNIDLSKMLSDELYKNYNTTTNKNILDVDRSRSFYLNKILINVAEHILDYTQADGISILLYDKDKKGLVPFIKLREAKKQLENVEIIPFNVENLYSDVYKSYLNNMFTKEKMTNLTSSDYISTDDLDYAGNYVIELSNEFIGFVGISYSNNNYPKFNIDEYMKCICSKISVVLMNIMLSNEVSAENKKREYTEKELEEYLDISVDLVAIVGKDGYIKRISHSWCNVLGWTEEELLSKALSDFVHPEELKSFKEGDNLENLDGKNTRNTIRFRHKDGKYIYIEWNSRYLGKEEIYVTTARDITKKLEGEKEKRKLEEAVYLEVVKNEFFSNISHEFRTPINIILGTMQIINKYIENNNIQIDSLKQYIKYIKQNSYRLLRLSNNLIDISKMDIGIYNLKCTNQNIINIIEDITLSVADYTKTNKINLIFDTDEEEVITYCDPDKIERIMLNLLSNAIKYTPQNGFIKVIVNVSYDEIIVSVKDSGTGIPEDKLNTIFDRFKQVDGLLSRSC